MAQGQNRESISLALKTLQENKLRSGLTILGVVIGVSTVIIISSVINGLNKRVNEWVASLGSNVIWVFHMPVIGVQPTTEMLTRKKLNVGDVEALRGLPHVVAVDGGHQHAGMFHVGNVAVKYKGRKISGSILQGSTVELAQVAGLNFLQGRLWTDQEDKRAAHVCVLGHDTWEELFGERDAIGEEVNVERGLYTVIGVLDKQKAPFGGSRNQADNMVYFPVETFRNLHPEDKDLWISVKYDDAKNKSLVEEEIREILRVRRKVPVQKPDNFEIFGPDALSKLWNQLTGGLVLFMISVSSVGLMVGGVGVMNIMLVSVTERTREIGVRKALGATKRNIMTQFTTEAVTMCAVGGILGLTIGAVCTWIIYFLPVGLPATMSAVWVVTGFAVSCVVGLIFGIYPAWKAANLDPIEALRYE